ncbi:MAG: serine/threonine protein kinase, partial [Planctomycetes bacterium]|nr:serine/threonine protein kinase [Planctomycetota bacterium]
MNALPHDDEDLLAELLGQALEASDRGAEPDLAALCGDRQDLVPELAAALGMRGDLPGLHGRASTADDHSGRILAGRYRLDQAIGQGAVGAVFRARDLRLDRDVAVKLLHHGLFSSPDTEARFHREAEVLAQNEHPHIVRIYDQGRDDDGAAFLVTELLRGASLQTVLDASRAAMPDGPDGRRFAANDWLRELLPAADLEHSYLRQVVTWIRQLTTGLATAHGQGVFHRDIKPSNIWIRDDGSAVLLDFGIAARDGDPSMTLPSAIVGTPCYMAPEQAGGRPEPKPTIDVYGLTATLYHLLTLTPPHEGDLQTVLRAVVAEDPEPATWRHPGLPRDLQAILDCGLEHDLGRRYPTVDGLGQDLAAFLDHRPVSVRPIGPLHRFARRCRRRPARTLSFVLGAGLVAVLVLVVPLWAALELQAANDERDALLA